MACCGVTLAVFSRRKPRPPFGLKRLGQAADSDLGLIKYLLQYTIVYSHIIYYDILCYNIL